MKFATPFLTLLLLGALLSGCALGTDKIALNYPQRGARDKVPGAEAVGVKVNLADQREVRDRVGKKMNGYGMEMGAIASTADVPGLVRGAIESELAARGFARGDSAVVACELNRFYNRFKLGFLSGDSIAEVIFSVQVKGADGTVLFTKNIMAEGQEPNIQMAVGHNAKAALEKGLGKAVDTLFQDPLFLPAIFKAAGANAPSAQK